MKYLCLIYDDESRLAGRSPDEAAAFTREYMELTQGLHDGGQHLAGEALQRTATAVSVRVRDGRASTTDGPFAETKEQLGGFYLVEARDLNDAIQVAARIPSARYGSVEVRPVAGFSRP